jgi:hypothetical protein
LNVHRSAGFTAYPLYAAVAFARFAVPDGYVAPHDSPAAYARAVEGRPPKVVDVPTGDRGQVALVPGRLRAQSGPSAEYTFLYRV